MSRLGLPLQLGIAVVHPLVAVGLVLAGAHLNAYGSQALGVVLLIAGMVTWLSTMTLDPPGMAVFLGGVALMVACVTAWSGTHTAVLHDRGVRTTCTVLEVTEQTETHTSHDADGRVSSTTRTSYDHDLRCPDAPIAAMTLSSRAADAGQRLDVTYDPAGRVDPQPAARVSDGSGPAWLAGTALTVSVVLRVIGVLRDRRHPAGYW